MRRRAFRPKTASCRNCKRKIKVKPKGPIPQYCRNSCRQLAYQKRRHSGPLLALASDIATARVRDAIRAEVRSVLQEDGLLPQCPPPTPPQRPQARKTKLELVKK